MKKQHKYTKRKWNKLVEKEWNRIGFSKSKLKKRQ